MMVKDAYYFPHDSNARNDPRMLMLRAKYGTKGYGSYFMLIEILREQSDYRIKIQDLTLESLALGLGCTLDYLKGFIEHCVNLQLLTMDTHLYSSSLLRRMGRWDEGRKKRVKKAKVASSARWKKGDAPSIAQALPEHSSSNAQALLGDAKERKGEEKRGDENKEKRGKANGTDFQSHFCQYNDRGQGSCTEPVVKSSKYCEHHKLKVRDMYLSKNEKRGGGFKSASELVPEALKRG